MIAKEVADFRAEIRRQQVPHLTLNTPRNSAGLAKIPDRDTILNSPTAILDPDALVVGTGHYQPPGVGSAMSVDLERELSGGINVGTI